MSFVQLISYRTSDPEQVDRLLDDWITDSAGVRTAKRTRVGRDRQDPNRYVEILEFDSYEDAVHNSRLRATTDVDERFRHVVEDLSFTDLDIVRGEDL